MTVITYLNIYIFPHKSTLHILSDLDVIITSTFIIFLIWLICNVLVSGMQQSKLCIYIYIKYGEKSENVSRSIMSNSLWPHRLWPTRLLCPWNSPDKNSGVGSHALLQGIFPTQGLNPCLPHCRQILYCLSHQGSPIYMQTHSSSDSFLIEVIRKYWVVSCALQ